MERVQVTGDPGGGLKVQGGRHQGALNEGGAGHAWGAGGSGPLGGLNTPA